MQVLYYREGILFQITTCDTCNISTQGELFSFRYLLDYHTVLLVSLLLVRFSVRISPLLIFFTFWLAQFK